VVTDTPAEAAEGTTIVLTMLADGEAVVSAMDADGGALRSWLADHPIWLQMSRPGRAPGRRHPSGNRSGI
jgi:3-hydroxyisobutyrate dehydrogenase-like beta-hydroxyacid dehydrogenase